MVTIKYLADEVYKSITVATT